MTAPGLPSRSEQAAAPARPETRAAVATALRLALGTPLPRDGGSGWTRVFEVASRELIAPLAWARSGQTIRSRAPAEIAAAWRRTSLAAHLHGQRQLDVLQRTLHVLGDAGVDATVLKGLPLGERLYGDTFARCSSDVDLHVPPEHRLRATRALEADGWSHDDGCAPWHEAWCRRDDHGDQHLELHSILVCDHLAHVPAPGPLSAIQAVGGVAMRVHCGAFLPAYLATHLATHQMPPLLWLVDFATLWESLSSAEQAAAQRAAVDARLDRYLAWARDLARIIDRVAIGDDAALDALGIGDEGRRDVHSIWRHLRFAATTNDRVRLILAFLVPRRVRGSIADVARYSAARVRTRLASLTGAHRQYGRRDESPSGNAERSRLATLGLRGLRVERDDMVSLTRDVVGSGGTLRTRAPGGSMLPTIPRGGLVRIGPVPHAGVQRGDIVLALTADGEPVLHRAVAIHGDVVVLRGDAALAADPPVPMSRVIGIATHVVRDGEERRLTRSPVRSVAVTALKLRRRIARAVRRGWHG